MYNKVVRWETLKPTVFSRIGDLKPNRSVVAHLKTPFFVPMEIVPFRQRVLDELILSSKEYSKLLGYDIFIRSSEFVEREIYVIRFYEGNFLHLTGVKTKLKAAEFFDKCFTESIAIDEFDCDSTPTIKGTVRHKLQNLLTIGSFFDKQLMCQENYNKGNIQCLLATSDGKFTIGFTGGHYSLNPQTLLHKNLLDPTKTISNIQITKQYRLRK